MKVPVKLRDLVEAISKEVWSEFEVIRVKPSYEDFSYQVAKRVILSFDRMNVDQQGGDLIIGSRNKKLKV